MRVLRNSILVAMLLVATNTISAARADSEAQYIANAGVMVVSGDVKIVFDPLFREDFDQYELAPVTMQRQLVQGMPPFDGIDAVFVSHSHDDHFDPELMLEFLSHNKNVRFFGPNQALSALRAADPAATEAVSERLSAVSPEYGVAPMELEFDGLQVVAINIPHEGWPNYMSDVENVAFSVTLDASTTVVHLGDADTQAEHFQYSAEYWRSRHHHLALPPYWFFVREQGRKALEDRIAADHAVGVHVPTRMPDEPQSRPPEFEGYDLFTQPGETRRVGL